MSNQEYSAGASAVTSGASTAEAHSPLPWSVASSIFARVMCRSHRKDAHNYFVADCVNDDSFQSAEDMANAALICRAVNNHGPLLAALEALLLVCDEELDPKRVPEMAKARAAITAAKEQA